MKKIRLPSFFKFRSANDLIRLGSEDDGGYLASLSDVENSDFLIGLGINDDWSFESDFVAQRDVPLLAYDASVNQDLFRRRLLKAFLTINRKTNLMRQWRAYHGYKSFFSNERRQHIQKFVGMNSGLEDDCSLESVLNDIPYDNIFLKIDVEGSEYNFLDSIVRQQARFSGIVIEFHDCAERLVEIKAFMDKLDMALVHIHPNNCGIIDPNTRVSSVIEFTFSRTADLGTQQILPHPLDRPNKKTREDFELVIDDPSRANT